MAGERRARRPRSCGTASTAACGAPAFGQYRHGGKEPWALVVLDIVDDKIVNMTYFLDTATLFPKFGLPMQLPDE